MLDIVDDDDDERHVTRESACHTNSDAGSEYESRDHGIGIGTDGTGGGSKYSVLPSALFRMFRGVLVATKTLDDVAEPLRQWISSWGSKEASDWGCQDHDDTTTALQPHKW